MKPTVTNPKCTTTTIQLSSTKSVLKEGGGEDRSKIIWGYITYQPQDLQRKHVTSINNQVFFWWWGSYKKYKSEQKSVFLERGWWRTDERLFGFYISQDLQRKTYIYNILLINIRLVLLHQLHLTMYNVAQYIKWE